MKEISIEEIYLNELNGLNNWKDLSRNYKLTEDIIIEFKDKLNWYYICEYQKLSENFKK